MFESSYDQLSYENKQFLQDLRRIDAKSLLVDIHGGHESHQNLW